jgi:hypothetical protein
MSSADCAPRTALTVPAYVPAETPAITTLRVVPVAGRDSMLLNLCTDLAAWKT